MANGRIRIGQIGPGQYSLSAEYGAFALVGQNAGLSATTGEGPFFETDFSQYSAGQSVTGTGSNGFSWIGGNGNGAEVHPCPWDTDINALRFTFSPNLEGDSHYWCEQRWNCGRQLQEIWWEHNVYFPDGTEPDGDGGTLARYEHNSTGTSNNRKFFIMYANEYQQEPLTIYQLWRDGASTDSTMNLGYTYGDENFDMDTIRYYRDGVKTGSQVHADLIGSADRGRWINLRFNHRIADIGVYNGHSRVWKDGVLIYNAQGLPNWDETESRNYVQRGYLFGDDNTQGRYTTTTHLYITDVKVYDSNPGW